MDRKEFIDYINKIRLQNKNKWYFIELTINNKLINIKGYDTWLQIFRIDYNGVKCCDPNGINYCNTCDMKVTEFKEYLGSIYSNHINNVLERA